MDPDRQVQQHQQSITDRQRLAQIDQMKQSVQPFVQAANSGGFGISGQGGDSLLKAINQCREGLNAARRDLNKLQQDTKLGTSPDAMVMTSFNREVADGGSNSAVTSLQGLAQVLDQMEAGVKEAMKHYHASDTRGSGNLHNAH